MKNFTIFSLILISGFAGFQINACSEFDNQTNTENKPVVVEIGKAFDTLLFIRETPADFKTPESVKYDKTNNIFYVANINGKPTEKDGNGFVSKLNLSGEIVELKWIVGLNAPKGMGIYNNKLYVSDIDELVEISIVDGKIIRKFPAKDAKFLNDIDVDENGNVYVSDMASNRIFKFNGDDFSVWCESTEFVNPNGLFVKKDYLLVGVKNKILSVNIKSKEIKTFIDNTGSIDGLESVENNQYVFSNWSGHIHTAKPNGSIKLLLNTAKDTVQAADIEYYVEKNMILVPTFYHNTVSFYKLTE